MKYTFYTLALALSSLFIANTAFSQGFSFNTSGAPANAAAIMDVSSTTQGVLIPRMTAAQRTAIASPATGLLVYQTDGTPGFYFYQGGWSILGGGAPSGAAGGGLAGTYPNPTIATGAVGVSQLSATGTANSTTFHRGDNTWAAPFTLTTTGSSGAATFSGGTLNVPTYSGASGSASGDLAGSYPSPTIANTATSGNNIVTALGSATTGTIPVARVGTSSGSATTFLNGTGAFSTPAGGGASYIWCGTAVVNAGTSPNWSQITGSNNTTTSEVQQEFLIPVTCTIDAFYVNGYTRAAGSGSNTVTGEILKNGVGTGMTVSLTASSGTVNAAATSVTSNTSSTVAVTAGDRLTIQWTDGTLGGHAVQAQFGIHAH